MNAPTQAALPMVVFPDGVPVPALGQGTWRMGEARHARAAEVAALKLGIELGMTLIDTAEMYGEGGAEEVVAEAVGRDRDRVFLVSKVYPHNAGAKSAIAACERSLKRLRTDHLDLYLLHWRGRIPLAETVDAFERLRIAGKILRWGVSNFDVDDLDELAAVPGAGRCAANQVMYHLGERGIEWALARRCADQGIPVMAYSPVGAGDLLRAPALVALAHRLKVAPAQLALAWLLSRRNTVVIPKATSPDHVRENRGAADLELSPAAIAALERAFPPPTRATPLAVS